MFQERFEALMAGLAASLELDDLPDLFHKGLINVAGTDVLLGCAPDGSVRMVLDLGPLPQHEPELLRRLLQLNLRRADDAPLTLALHPVTGHIVGVALVAPEILESPEALSTWLLWQVPSWVARLKADLQATELAAGGESPAGAWHAQEVLA